MKPKPKPKPKKSQQHDVNFAEGGSRKMFGEQSAGPQKPAITGKAQTAAPGAKRARGGPPVYVGGLALPAQGGHTAPIGRKGR
jgi:hypothetical protein